MNFSKVLRRSASWKVRRVPSAGHGVSHDNHALRDVPVTSAGVYLEHWRGVKEFHKAMFNVMSLV